MIIWICTIFGFLFICFRLSQRQAYNNVTLAFKDAKVSPPFSREKIDEKDSTDDKDDKDDTDDTDDSEDADNTNDTDDTVDTDETG